MADDAKIMKRLLDKDEFQDTVRKIGNRVSEVLLYNSVQRP